MTWEMPFSQKGAMLNEIAHFSSAFAFAALALGVAVLGRKFVFLRHSRRLFFVLVCVDLVRDSLREWGGKLPAVVGQVFLFAYIFVIVMLVNALLKDLVKEWMTRRGLKISKLVWDVLSGIVYLVLVLVLMKEIFDVNITPFLAGSAVLTVVIGLAVQDTLINLIAGVVFHFEDSIHIGEWIEIDGKVGEVRELTWRAIRLVTNNDDVLVVPNQDFTKKRFTNLSRLNAARVMEVGASYLDDPDTVMRALRKALLSSPGVLWEPEPDIYVLRFADSSIQYRIKYFISDYRRHTHIEGQIHRSIWYFFQVNHIQIPFPIRTVQIQRPRNAEIAEPGRSGIMDVLRGLDMFRILDEVELEAVAKYSEILEFPKGAVVALEGEEGHSMFAIVKGVVDIVKEGRKIAALGPHDIFGEIALFTGERRKASVIAAGPLQVVITLKEGFDTILKQNADFISKIERMIDVRLSVQSGSEDGESKTESRLNILRHIRKYLLGE